MTRQTPYSFLLLLMLSATFSHTSHAQENPGFIQVSEPNFDDYITDEQLIVFTIQPVQAHETTGFIDISEVYPTSEDPDSLAIPDMTNLSDSSYFVLDHDYRKRMLDRSGISESDTIFVYDYAARLLLTFPVSQLQSVAWLDDWSSPEEWPYPQERYRFGFEIDRTLLKAANTTYFATVLVYIGRESPFIIGELQPIVWKKIPAKSFPAAKMSRDSKEALKGFTPGNAYESVIDVLHYYVQELNFPSPEYPRDARRLLVISTRTGKVVCERVYIEDEGAGLSELNYINPEVTVPEQWTGQLFKTREPVLFGFEYNAYLCQQISFIGDYSRDIYVLCDNRN